MNQRKAIPNSHLAAAPACGSAVWRLAALALSAALAGPVLADQDVKSSDGQWKAHAKIDGALAVGKSAEAVVDISAAAGGKSCPAVSSVVFEMPSHGHGGKVDPQVMDMGNCQFHVSSLNPSMGGDWRLRLVLKADGKTSNADFAVSAK
jgi:hypothetical protein